MLEGKCLPGRGEDDGIGEQGQVIDELFGVGLPRHHDQQSLCDALEETGEGKRPARRGNGPCGVEVGKRG
jgi:hypothetical protein